MKNTLERNNSDLWTESEGWKKIFHTNVNNKKAEVVILISDDVDFKTGEGNGNPLQYSYLENPVDRGD